jgi:hypothetical protein
VESVGFALDIDRLFFIFSKRTARLAQDGFIFRLQDRASSGGEAQLEFNEFWVIIFAAVAMIRVVLSTHYTFHFKDSQAKIAMLSEIS